MRRRIMPVVTTPSRTYRRQVAAMRLLAEVADVIRDSHARAGVSMPPEVAASVAALRRAINDQWARIGHEALVIRTPSAKRAMRNEARAMAASLDAAWPGHSVPTAELINAALLIVEDIRAGAPDDGRRQGWGEIAALLAHISEVKAWDVITAVEAGAAAGATMQEVWK